MLACSRRRRGLRHAMRRLAYRLIYHPADTRIVAIVAVAVLAVALGVVIGGLRG